MLSSLRLQMTLRSEIRVLSQGYRVPEVWGLGSAATRGERATRQMNGCISRTTEQLDIDGELIDAVDGLAACGEEQA